MVRHEAALALVESGELDPVLALSLVVWPRKGSRLEDVPLERQYHAEDVRQEIRARHKAGESIPELALKTGVPLRSSQVHLQHGGSEAGAGRFDAALALDCACCRRRQVLRYAPGYARREHSRHARHT
jgi:hypothetical protein